MTLERILKMLSEVEFKKILEIRTNSKKDIFLESEEECGIIREEEGEYTLLEFGSGLKYDKYKNPTSQYLIYQKNLKRAREFIQNSYSAEASQA